MNAKGESNESAELDRQRRRRSLWTASVEIVLILIFILMYTGGPPPDVNEAHYLAKAKHFWNRDWCPGDHFLESANAHLVFYWTFGWLTRVFSLPVTAWLARLVIWISLAIAWRRLSHALVPRPWFSAISAVLFLLLSHFGQMMGEWVVGGVEAKSMAYALVLFALGSLVLGRWNEALLMIGAASSMHVVVGGWSAIALAVAWLCQGQARPSLTSIRPGILLGFLLCLPGLIPALTLSQGTTSEQVRQASEIQIFQRLPHHLLIQHRPLNFIAAHLSMFVLWFALSAKVRSNSGHRRLQAFVSGAVSIAATGAVINLAATYSVLSPDIMKYYWYRVSDAVMPIGCAMAATTVVASWSDIRPVWYRWTLGISMLIAAVFLGKHLGERLIDPRPGSQIQATSSGQMSPSEAWHSFQDWRRVCAWIESSTKKDARFLTPVRQQTFKWYAGRSEVVTWKDVPQDVTGVIEWWNRIETIHRTHGQQSGQESSKWRNSLSDWSQDELIGIAKRHGCSYIVLDVGRTPPSMSVAHRVYPVLPHRNRSYEVYIVPDESNRALLHQ